jgi:hypothetical protein
MQLHSTRAGGRALVALGALLLVSGAAAEEPQAPVVPLDQLLKLPSSAPVEASIERRGGNTKSEWQARFRSAREDVSKADAELEQVRADLEKVAGRESSWTMSAPGLGAAKDPTDTPLDYRLSQDLKKTREEAARARQALQDLEVEANLAGVPESWRKSGSDQGSTEQGASEQP